MRRRFPSRFVAAMFVFSVMSALSGWAAVPNRIKGSMVDAQVLAQTGNVSPMVRRAADQGRLKGSLPLTGLSLNFAPSAAQQADLNALLVAQQDPGSPNYHQWLTPAQFGARFGMSDSDLAVVSGWLQSHGLTVDRVAPSRNAIHFSGTVSRVEEALHTELHALTLDGESHFANTNEPSLPSAFAGTVSAVRGLNDFRPKPHAKTSTRLVPYTVNGRAVSARSGSSPVPNTVDGTGVEYISPEDFANIYDVKAMYNAGFSGSASYPIGIVGQTAIKPQDITDFRTSFGLTTNAPTPVLVPGTGSSAINSTDDLSESELDLEWSGAVAPSASLYFIYTGNSSNGTYLNYDVFDALQYSIQTYTINGKPLPIISISYGECEPSDTTADFTAYESWFQQANAQGQTIVSASGDDGAAGCDYTTNPPTYAATGGLAVSYPASSAYVTGVGGTSFSGDLTSLSSYWSASNDKNYGNELGLFIPSTSWNNTPTPSAATSFQTLSASGGGASALWPKPAWQAGVAGIPTDGKRDVPDVALNADPDHDGYLVCINQGCEGQGANFNVYGGTSVAAPSFAGMLALAEQKLGHSEGNVNPLLYGIAATAATANAFYDITSGSNVVPCIVSPTDTGCMGGTMGFNAGTGYDQVTGLGAIDAFNLATALGTTSSKVATTTALTYAPATPVTGQTITFMATVGQGSGSTAPTGSVVFTVDGAATGTSVVVTAGVAMFTTTFTTGGGHTVSAVYSGDTTYYGSSATSALNLTIAANPNNAATITAVTASSPSVAAGNPIPAGSSLTLTATVSSTTAGTLTGTVTFSTPSGILVGRTPLPAGCAATCTATPVTITVSTASLPVGTDTITATYGGGGSDTAGGQYTSSSGTVNIAVTNPAIMLTAPNITVADGSNGVSMVTITSSGGYSGNVTFYATSSSAALLNYASVNFSPTNVSLSAGGTATTTFTIYTSAATAAAVPGSSKLRSTGGTSLLLTGGGLSVAGLLFFGLGRAGARRKRLPSMLVSLLALMILGSAAGCGSSSSSTGGGGGTSTLNIPKGTYSLTIIGTDSTNTSITGSTNVTLTLN